MRRAATEPDVMPHEFDLVLIDDSGLLGLVDALAYTTYVAEDWEYEQLIGHFASNMQRSCILVWDCGDGGNDYRIRVRNAFTTQGGFREAIGEITATTNQLYLASYTALTMAAQFPEYHIPGKHEEDLAIPVVPGRYRLRLVQMYDPKQSEHLEGSPHFLLELEPGDGPTWSDVAWRAA